MRLTRTGAVCGAVILAACAIILPRAVAAPKTFIIASSANPTTLNPVLTTEFPAHFTSAMLFNSLVTTTLEFRTEPDLAESWKISPDGLTYTFVLRDGVTWHDGKPFTAHDVKFTVDELWKKYAPHGPSVFASIESASVVDPRTITLTLKTRFAPLMTYLGTPYFSPILPKHLYEGTDVVKNEYNAKPVGTGPFVFDGWVRGQHIKLRKNAAYFKKGLPLLESAVVQIMPDEPGRLRALERGEIDMAVLIPNHVVPKWQRSKEIDVTSETWKSFASLGWVFVNMRSPIVGGVDDKGRKVRQALYHTLDRKAVLEKVYFGAGRIAAGPINSAHTFAFKPGLPSYEFDLARAGKLLDEAGYPRKADGLRFRLNMPVTVSRAEFSKVPELWREDLKKVGIELNLITSDDTAFLDRTFKQWDYDVFYTTPYTGPDPSVSAARFYISSNIKKAAFTNASGYSNPRVDELFQRAQTDVDPEARKRAFWEIQDILVRDLPCLWILEIKWHDAYASRFKSVGLSPFGPADSRERVDLK
jgi:peptide/nickel transport system substrate-binding protein